MEFKFIGNPADATDNRGELWFRGIRFPLNIPVPVTDPVTIQKLMGNNHFAICGPDGKTHMQIPAADLILPKSVETKPRRGRKSAVTESANP